MCTVLPEPGMAAHPRAHTRNTRPGDASTRSGTTPGHVRAISLIRPVPDHPNHRHNLSHRLGAIQPSAAATPQLSTGNPRDAAVRTQQCSCIGTRPSSGSGRPPRHDHTVLTAKHGHPSAIPHTKWASRTARHIRSTTSPRPRVCGGAPGLLHPLSYKATIRPIRPRFLSIDSH